MDRVISIGLLVALALGALVPPAWADETSTRENAIQREVAAEGYIPGLTGPALPAAPAKACPERGAPGQGSGTVCNHGVRDLW